MNICTYTHIPLGDVRGTFWRCSHAEPVKENTLIRGGVGTCLFSHEEPASATH